MTSQTPYTDIRLVPITAEHHAALLSDDASQIVACVRFIVGAYEQAPPLTVDQALIYSSDVEWWKREISDL